MWTTKNRARDERKGLRYESDLTDEEYALIEPFLPPGRNVSRRSLVNGILYVLTTGCQWRQLPKDFPPRSTTHDDFVELQCTGCSQVPAARKNSSWAGRKCPRWQM
jgi:transposase